MIEIRYFLDKEPHASRTREAVPRKGDWVKLRTGMYRVELVCWIDNAEHGDSHHVAIDLVKVHPKKPKS